VDRARTTTLLREARAGSPEALDRLLERYAGKLLAYIRARMGRGLRPRVDSHDVLNETLLRAFLTLSDFEGIEGRSLMAWLARIAERQIRDLADFHGRQRRDAWRERPLETGHAELAARLRSATSRIVLRDEVERVLRALDTLDGAQRQVILLRKLEELSFAEIGERMGRSPDACRMLLARAMTALTLRLEDEP
jgi:RNA polymerase sigma-70 factor (ECF subfamily)